MKVATLARLCLVIALLSLSACSGLSIGLTNSPPSPNSCSGDARPSSGVCPR